MLLSINKRYLKSFGIRILEKIKIEYVMKNSLKLLYQMVVVIGDNDMANFEINNEICLNTSQ